MESSLNREPAIIGNIEHGIGYTSKEKEWLKAFKECSRKNMFDKKCLECPIASNCSYCLGCCYD